MAHGTEENKYADEVDRELFDLIDSAENRAYRYGNAWIEIAGHLRVARLLVRKRMSSIDLKASQH